MVELEGLCKHYGTGGRRMTAVEDASLHVGRGDFVSIMGHSGSGKTTLLSLLGGLTRPTAGTVRVDGVDLWGMDDRRLTRLHNRHIAFVYQFASLIPTLTALENVMLPVVFGTPSPDARGHALELLSAQGRVERADTFPGQLSGGEQRRVAIARSFINAPAVVLADEPTGELDEETEGEVFEVFRRMNQQGAAFVRLTYSRLLEA